MKKIAFMSLLLALIAAAAFAQAKPKFSYAAQKKLIPVDLGQVYLGMPLKDFAARIDITKAEADDRFDWLELEIPLAKGNVTGLSVRVHGLSMEEKAAILHEVKVKKKGDTGEEYETDGKQIKPGAVLSKGFVYAIYVDFKKDFDLKKHVNATYSRGEVRKPDDQYHFFDTQWTKKTPDGLTWLIRAFHEDGRRSLQLLGRIDGTEWDPGV
ncbi:MAG: hypothetical protein ABL984_00760 [Pyrinomonadaceae bacterium]